MERILTDPVIYQGRPERETDRLPTEVAVYDMLDRLGISFERVDHEATATIEQCHEIDRILDIEICKNLFLCNRQKTDFYLLMMPGKKPFKTKELSAQIGSSRLSFADASHMEEFLSLSPGSVSILGLMNDKECRVKLLMDEEVADTEYIGCHPCVNTSSLKIRTKDILERFLPEVRHIPEFVRLTGEG